MKLIGLFKNENVAVPELPVVPPTRAHWEYVGLSTDHTKPFTKVRISDYDLVSDYRWSNISGVNSDDMSNSQCLSAAMGRGNWLRTCYWNGVGLTLPDNNDFTDFSSHWSDNTLYTCCTYIGVGEDGCGVWEYEYPITLYWSGTNDTNNYSTNPYMVQIYID